MYECMEYELGHQQKGFGRPLKTKDNTFPNAGAHWRPSEMGKATAVKRAE